MPGADDHPPTRGFAAGVGNALARIRRLTGADLAFGGRVAAAGVLLEQFDGVVVGPLRGVRLDLGHGLGGRVVAQRRALAVPDYVATPLITHRYDAIIRAERLRSFAAVPVIVDRAPVAVLYASQRTGGHELGRVLDAVAHEARALEQELAVDAARDAMSAQLTALAGRTGDSVLSAELRRLAGAPAAPAVELTAREHDVLELLAAGRANRDIADALGIGLHTVKDHVKHLLAKLHAANRTEAAARARRQGLLR